MTDLIIEYKENTKTIQPNKNTHLSHLCEEAVDVVSRWGRVETFSVFSDLDLYKAIYLFCQREYPLVRSRQPLHQPGKHVVNLKSVKTGTWLDFKPFWCHSSSKTCQNVCYDKGQWYMICQWYAHCVFLTKEWQSPVLPSKMSKKINIYNYRLKGGCRSLHSVFIFQKILTNKLSTYQVWLIW